MQNSAGAAGLRNWMSPQPEPQAPVAPAPPHPLSAPLSSPRPAPSAPIFPSSVQPPVPVCSMCGAPLNPDRKFCGSCGAPIVTVPPVSGPVPIFTPSVPAPVPLLVCASCGNALFRKGKILRGVRGSRGLTFTTVEGKSGFLIGDDERFTGLLRLVYGTKVHLPSGYTPAGGVRIIFFNFFMGIQEKKGEFIRSQSPV